MKFIFIAALLMQLAFVTTQDVFEDHVMLNHHHSYNEMVNVLQETHEKCPGAVLLGLFVF